MHRFASVALGILIAVTSLAYAGEMDEVVAIDTAQRAIERAVRVGDENLVPKHTLAGARVSGVIAVHHPQTLEPVYGLAPVLSTSGDLVAVIGLDATGLRALWYRFGNLSERFPMVSGREAQAQASQRAATLGRDTVLEEPILIAGFDKHIYWRIAGPTGDIWLVDMDQPGRDVLGTAVGEADEALSPEATAKTHASPAGSQTSPHRTPIGESACSIRHSRYPLSLPDHKLVLWAGITPDDLRLPRRGDRPAQYRRCRERCGKRGLLQQ
jgi:hypothetical protein